MAQQLLIDSDEKIKFFLILQITYGMKMRLLSVAIHHHSRNLMEIYSFCDINKYNTMSQLLCSN